MLPGWSAVSSLSDNDDDDDKDNYYDYMGGRYGMVRPPHTTPSLQNIRRETMLANSALTICVSMLCCE